MKRWISYYIPLYAFHDNWTNLKKSSFTFSVVDDTAAFHKSMGYIKVDGEYSAEIGNWRNFEQRKLKDESLSILDAIVQTCKENNIGIIFYTAPSEGSYSYYDAMEKYAAENGCVYINFYEKMEEAGIDCETDFCDSGHLNASGAIKIADYIGQFIVDNYDVTDMRQIEGNLWQ